MKNIARIIIVLLLVLITSFALAFTAFATEEDTSGKFVVTYGTKTVEGKGFDALKSAIGAIPSSSTDPIKVKLLGDMLDVTNKITIPSNKDFYFDLAGFKYASTGATGDTLFTNNSTANSTAYFYSSRPGGAIFHATSSDGTTPKGHLVFYLSANNFTLNLGEATVDGVTYSGDNFAIYASGVADNSKKGETTNTVLNINGGSYFRTSSGTSALFILRSNATVNINNAFLYAPNRIFTLYNTEGYPSNATVNVKKSTVYCTSSSGMIDEFNEEGSMTFEDCYIIGHPKVEKETASVLGRNEGYPTFVRCLFVPNARFTTDSKIVNAFEYKEIEYKINKFSFYVASTSTDESGNVTNTYRVDPASFELETVKIVRLFTQATANEGEYSNITWDLGGGKTLTEKWLNGQTPVPPVNLPEETNIYEYRFAGLSAATGDVTYTAKAYANFPVKANITLYTDFVYNVYIPVYAEEHINSVSIEGTAFSLKDAEKVSILGVEHYWLSYPIFASNGASSYSLVINIDGYDSAFDQNYALSIPEYSKYILSGNYEESSKALMRTVLAYIRAAVNIAGNDAGAIDLIEGITDAQAPTDTTAAKAPPEDFTKLFSNVQLSVGSKINFRFNVKEGVKEGVAQFTFPVNGVNKTITVTEEDWTCGGETGYYYEVTMRARDLGRNITVKVGNSTYTYSLSNYVNYANTKLTEDKYALVRTLVNNLWAYYKASYGYTNSTPEIDITVNGNDIRNYEIVAVSSEERAAAELIQSAIYAKVGVNLPIVSSATSGKNSIKVLLITGTEARDKIFDYTVYEYGSNLYIRCEYTSFIKEGTESFIRDYISSLIVDYDFKEGFEAGYVTDRVYYSDFGAKGDTVLTLGADGLYTANGTDDFVTIKFAHTTANSMLRHTVYADPGKIYYICDTAPDGKTVEKISIKTDTVWTGAQFVIDDTNLHQSDAIKRYSSSIFVVESQYSSYTVTDPAILASLAGIGPHTKKIDPQVGYAALINVVNTNHKVYIRFGKNANSGADQHELVVVDEEGNIQSGTELLLDYEAVTSLECYRIDQRPLSVKGGTVITLATRMDTTLTVNGEAKKYSSYFARNFSVRRSNTTVEGLEHKVYNEFTVEEEAAGLTGACYSGFFGAGTSTNVTFLNCIMCARRYYLGGTYGFSATLVNNIVLKDCIQSNFYKPGTTTLSTANNEYWGIGGTNYCKNMIYDGCTLTRYDAHSGLYNGKIINCTIGMVNLIGGGDMLIQNSVIMDTEVFTLRSDYGATWKGTVTISDTVLDTASSSPRICAFIWSNHDFGYTCYFPNIILDNFQLREGNKSTVKIAHSGWDYTTNESGEDKSYEAEHGGYTNPIHLDVLPLHAMFGGGVEYDVVNKNPYVPPEYIKVYNNRTGVKYDFLERYDFFKNTEVYIYPPVNDDDSPMVPVE